jgi:hypothetical protein
MGKKLILILATITLIGTVSASEYNKTIDITPSGPFTYDLNEKEPVNFTVKMNTTDNIETAYLQTNEGLETRNYTRYTYDIETNNNGTDITYRWDNQFPVTSQKKIDFQPYIITSTDRTYSLPVKGVKIYLEKREATLLSQENSSEYNNWTNWENVIDGDYSTYGEPSSGDGLNVGDSDTVYNSTGYFNYSTINSSLNPDYIWKVKDQAGNHTLTLPDSCTHYPIQTRVESYEGSLNTKPSHVSWECLNQSSQEWIQIFNNTDSDVNQRYRVYEEQMYIDNVTREMNNTIQTIIKPEIHSFVAEDIEKGENSLLQVKATHPVGYAEINRVQFKINRPDSKTDNYIARREKRITIDGNEGNIFQAYYTETDETGYYEVTAQLVTDERVIEKTIDFTVEEKTAPERPDVSLQPFSIGGTSWVAAGSQISKVNVVYQLFIGLQLLIIATTFAIVLGGSGFEEAEYENLGSQNTGYTS